MSGPSCQPYRSTAHEHKHRVTRGGTTVVLNTAGFIRGEYALGARFTYTFITSLNFPVFQGLVTPSVQTLLRAAEGTLGPLLLHNHKVSSRECSASCSAFLITTETSADLPIRRERIYACGHKMYSACLGLCILQTSLRSVFSEKHSIPKRYSKSS